MLTVLFATRNRASILRDVLECFCGLNPPASGWKLVVIDNGSTDETQQVLDSFLNRLPLHPLYEPALGKNSALNKGLGLIEGDLTVFTDDDVFPRPDWLLQLRKTADDQPSYSIFGGAILPRWETPPPLWTKWIDLGPVFTITPASLKDGDMPPMMVQGPNMAVRSSVFSSGTYFDISIGPRGADYPMGSESELVLRLCGQGHKPFHVRAAVVEHFVRNQQLNKDWVLRRAIRFGRGLYRLSPDIKLWFGLPRHAFRDFPKEAAYIVAAWLLMRPDSLFRSRWRFNILRGKCIEARNVARERQLQKQSTLAKTQLNCSN
jgi:glycosyltransferase involved in cell wall biosynthesis